MVELSLLLHKMVYFILIEIPLFVGVDIPGEGYSHGQLYFILIIPEFQHFFGFL